MPRGNWNIRHGGARRSGRSPEYSSWHHMLRRCRDPESQDFSNYGGRGIVVCERWQDYGSFIADMGARPTPQHTIERIDNNGNYEPGNCRWATRKEQNQNRRPRALAQKCQRGHDMTGDNAYQRPNGRKRGCKECRKQNMRDYYAKQDARHERA